MAKDTGMATLSHILGLLMGFLGPLIIMLATEDEFAEENARNALNFQIMMIIGFAVSFVLTFVLIGIIIFPILLLLDLVFCIVAAAKANNGEAWKYPLTPDLV